MSRNSYANAKSYTRWSIRRLSVGVASVVVASGFFVLIGQPTVYADQVRDEPTLVAPMPSVSMAETGVVEEVPSATSSQVSESQEATESAMPIEVPKGAEAALAPREETSYRLLNAGSEKPAEVATTPVVNEASGSAVVSQAAPVAEPVTTPEQVKQAVTDNVKENTDVPASYLEKANVPGPFLAGVNQVIPYEAFGGDGMLTRLLLKASDGAPWSDNGTAKNPALLPLEKLGHGQYFYEVDLNGNTVGKDGQALLDQLRANGTQAYMATVKVYAAKDGKADLTNLVASRDVIIRLNGKVTPAGQGKMSTPSSMAKPMMDTGKNDSAHFAQVSSLSMIPKVRENAQLMVEKTTKAPGMMANKANKMVTQTDKMMLPNTGEASNHFAGLGVVGLVLAGILSGLGLKKKEDKM